MLYNISYNIFKNIKHYYYFCTPTYNFDEYDNITYNKFWKDEEKFNFPKLFIPIKNYKRSLNLSNAVSICLYEAMRQNSFFQLS